jgi:hypothetical protein
MTAERDVTREPEFRQLRSALKRGRIMGGRRWLDWADARDIVQYTIDGKPELSTRNLKKWKLYDGVYQIGRGLREKGYGWEEVREEFDKLVSRRPAQPLLDRILDKIAFWNGIIPYCPKAGQTMHWGF